MSNIEQAVNVVKIEERPDVPPGTHVVYIDANGFVGRGTCLRTYADDDGVRRVEIHVDEATIGTDHLGDQKAIIIRPHLSRVGVDRFVGNAVPTTVTEDLLAEMVKIADWLTYCTGASSADYVAMVDLSRNAAASAIAKVKGQ